MQFGENRQPSEIREPARRPAAPAVGIDAGHGSTSADVAELERENRRLQLLVTELLIKNQELRKALCQ